MSDEEELVTIELTDLTSAELEMVKVVMHEGELRERERIIALLNAKFTEHKESGQKDDAWLWGFYAAISCILLNKGENK